MSVIRAHFDGKVFVPDDPVDVPAGASAEITIIRANETDGTQTPLAGLGRLAEKFTDVTGWPADGAAQTDHYLYGTPKREQ